MKLNSTICRAGAIALIATIPFVGRADDFAPPPWRLSDPSCTVQEWDFNSPNAPLAPDGNIWGSAGGGYVNPFGVPLLTSNTGATWLPTFGTHTGVYDINPNQASIQFLIPNDGPNPNEHKDLWVQMTGLAAGTVLAPDIFVQSVNSSGFATVASSQFTADGWVHWLFKFTLSECPAQERLTITNNTPVNIQMDQLVIDTICYNPSPEPAPIAALGLGVIVLVRRRRRK